MHYKTSNKKWNWFPILIPFWKKEVNEETEIWKENMCQLHQENNACLNPKDCCDSKKVKDNWLLKQLVKIKKGGLTIIGVSFISLAFFPCTIFSFKLFDNLNININWDYEDLTEEVNGKPITFRVAILAQEQRWKYESSTEIETGKLNDELPKYIQNLDGFKKAKSIIGVGVASEEGNLATEEDRADRRADEVMKIIKLNQIAKGKELYKLNLGQYQVKTNHNNTLTATQRRVIVIGIIAKENSMSFNEIEFGLKKALSKSKSLTVKINHYSQFEFYRIN